MNKKIAISIVSICMSLSLVAGGAYALFSSQASSTGNSFTTGNASLQLSTDASTWSSSISNYFSGANIFPGYSNNFVFYLRNNSSAAIKLGNTVQFTNTNGSDAGLSNALLVGLTCVDNANNNTPIGSVSAQAESAYATAQNIGVLNQNQVAKCTMAVSLPSSSDNTLAGKSVGFGATFNGTQQ